MLSRRGLIYGLCALMLAAVSFVTARAVVIDRAPKIVMSAIEARIAQAAGGWNACYHNRVFGPRANSARRANPDSIISSMAYDLSDGPVRVSGTTWPLYWSLSLYQQNSDNYFVINDQQLPDDTFDFILLKKGQLSVEAGATEITSPTEKGILLIRRFASQDSDMPAIHDNQDAMSCGPVSG